METLSLESPLISELIRLLENSFGGLRRHYRGHADAKWKLIPSLYRIQDINVMGRTKRENYDDFESNCVNLFFSEGLLYLPNLERSFLLLLSSFFGSPA